MSGENSGSTSKLPEYTRSWNGTSDPAVRLNLIPSRFSGSIHSIKYRLPLLIGTLLLGVIGISNWSSNLGTDKSALIGMCLLAIGTVCAIALSRSITRPLYSLTEATFAISRGDYSHSVDIKQPTELGELANAFNSMTVKIGESQRELERQLADIELTTSKQHLEQTLVTLQAKSDELAVMTQQLWQTSKLATMGELAANVAHELNNPLAIIALRAESLLEQFPHDEPKRQAMRVIVEEVDRMANLVNNLLQFSRRSHPQLSTVDVREEITNSCDFIHYYLRNRNAHVVTRFASSLPSVQADRQQLRQLFLNLLTNASDAMPNGGRLTVAVAGAQMDNGRDAVKMEFADTGIGIATENVARIWEPFFTTKPEGKGTGLGLAMCRRIVEEHKGTISLESQVGQGTTVRITLPATNNGGG